jgi:hypothetical protein
MLSANRGVEETRGRRLIPATVGSGPTLIPAPRCHPGLEPGSVRPRGRFVSQVGVQTM